MTEMFNLLHKRYFNSNGQEIVVSKGIDYGAYDCIVFRNDVSIYRFKITLK